MSAKMNQSKIEIMLAGSGGQGLIFCGMVLAEAAILEGKNVVQTQIYGIASRGGASTAEIIISDDEIIFQQVLNPDLVLALTDEALQKCLAMPNQPKIFYDTSLLKIEQGDNLYGYPFSELANKLGNVGVANIIALGVFATIFNLVKIESLEKVLNKKFSGKVAEANVKALAAGVELVKRKQV